MASYHQPALNLDQFEAVVWKGKVLGINAEAVADQHTKNIDAAVTMLRTASDGLGRAVELQGKMFQAASTLMQSLYAAGPITPQHGANLACEAAFTTLAGFCEAHDIVSSTVEEAFGTARKRAIEGVQQIRRHVRREDLY
ncbi:MULTISPECIES: hypothetical protein [unclassified Mesorhizobium]|nr:MULTISPECIES: hypothetical protein [unclassified Mesorhizobium]RWE20288.1 MAG: hypothetical protein EOS41_28875 [Mesorhizobium sp.]RWF25887.1 MAG: hypothetical protein EOS64_03195 [Mesorhizobium sp.]TGS67425.1 hypothetical protein EN844_14420 [Mesorhizobium sp. M3A.F.Ca.ET.201.01.1.1]